MYSRFLSLAAFGVCFLPGILSIPVGTTNTKADPDTSTWSEEHQKNQGIIEAAKVEAYTKFEKMEEALKDPTNEKNSARVTKAAFGPNVDRHLHIYRRTWGDPTALHMKHQSFALPTNSFKNGLAAKEKRSNKIDTSGLTPQEQKLFAMYGKLPTHKNVLVKMQKDRKYFDSGDYALSKARVAPQKTVGTAVLNPENIPHASNPGNGHSDGHPTQKLATTAKALGGLTAGAKKSAQTTGGKKASLTAGAKNPQIATIAKALGRLTGKKSVLTQGAKKSALRAKKPSSQLSATSKSTKASKLSKSTPRTKDKVSAAKVVAGARKSSSKIAGARRLTSKKPSSKRTGVREQASKVAGKSTTVTSRAGKKAR